MALDTEGARMIADFQPVRAWSWRDYVIEEETDATGGRRWYVLYHGHGRARYFSEFATAVAAAEEDAQA
jgi:hypothetical protein